MPRDAKAIDALLQVACSRMLSAGYKLNRMREALRQGDDEGYWRTAKDLADDFCIGGTCVTDANRKLLGDVPVFVPEKGGLVN